MTDEIFDRVYFMSVPLKLIYFENSLCSPSDDNRANIYFYNNQKYDGRANEIVLMNTISYINETFDESVFSLSKAQMLNNVKVSPLRGKLFLEDFFIF